MRLEGWGLRGKTGGEGDRSYIRCDGTECSFLCFTLRGIHTSHCAASFIIAARVGIFFSLPFLEVGLTHFNVTHTSASSQQKGEMC